MKPKLEILIGTIASGKSTYCTTRAEQGAIIINDDAIVTALHGGNYQLYNKKLKPLYKAVELSIMMHALIGGFDVVIDRPNLTRASRAKYLAPAVAMEFQVGFVVFPFKEPKVHAIRRCTDNARGYDFAYWQRVAERQISQYESPEVDEGHAYVWELTDY